MGTQPKLNSDNEEIMILENGRMNSMIISGRSESCESYLVPYEPVSCVCDELMFMPVFFGVRNILGVQQQVKTNWRSRMEQKMSTLIGNMSHLETG